MKKISVVIVCLLLGCTFFGLRKDVTLTGDKIEDASKGFCTYGTNDLVSLPYRTNALYYHDHEPWLRDIWQITDKIDYIMVADIRTEPRMRNDYNKSAELQNSLKFFAKPLDIQKDIYKVKLEDQKFLITRLIESAGRERVWEIGNEPNLLPYIPPKSAAYLYCIYYKFIKSVDPTAKVMNGGLFVMEAMPDIFKAFKIVLPEEYVYSTVEYYRIYLEEIKRLGCKVDIASIHIYPFMMSMSNRLKESLLEIRSLLDTHGVKEIWVTETGNINPLLPEKLLLSGTSDLLDFYIHNTVGITRWYWFKIEGTDLNFERAGLPGPVTGLTEEGKLSKLGELYIKKYEESK